MRIAYDLGIEVGRAAWGEDVGRLEWGFAEAIVDDVEPNLEHGQPPDQVLVEHSLSDPSEVVEVTSQACPPVPRELLAGGSSTREGVWSLFKRSIVGSYHQLSVKHLPAYVDEFEFRFNNRENPFLFRDTLSAAQGRCSGPMRS